MPRSLDLSKIPSSRNRILKRLDSITSIPPQPLRLLSPEQVAQLIQDTKTPSQALETFKWASKLPNFTHTQFTYLSLVKKLSIFRQFDTIHQVLDEIPRITQLPPDDQIFVVFIRGLGRARMVKESIKVLNLVEKFSLRPSVKIYNAILDVLVKEDIDVAKRFYREKMMECGVEGDIYTYGILMKGLCSTNRIADGFKLLQAMKKSSLNPNAVVYNTLLHALCRNGKVGRARCMMRNMEELNDVTFNIMISAYCKDRNLVQALVMLEKCLASGFMPDIIAVTKVLELLCSAGRMTEGVEVLERLESEGRQIDFVAYNVLVKGFCLAGKVRVGYGLLKEMERKGCLPNVQTYNLLISGFCDAEMLDSAVDLFNEMKRIGIEWNFSTYDILIRGLCWGGRTGDAFKILELMEETKSGYHGNISPYNSIIYGLYKDNKLKEALEFLTKMENLFPRAVERSLSILKSCDETRLNDAKRTCDQMVEEGGFPSALLYDSLLLGFCEKGHMRESLEALNMMIGRSYFPVLATLNSVIRGFCSHGRTDSAWTFLKDMLSREYKPDSTSFGLLVDSFSEKGELGKAWEVMLDMVGMGFVPDFCSWSSLVRCLSRENAKLWADSEVMLGDMILGC
ncbi:hypothetical protein MLD38_004754 [Melastoma candidum]|uniref:Uncharacterized protein n=1 Tax=Melastoma candidum TaxID=119954 RepID=A0ACB9S813_9MYRT|nr:hypothetical protein MLD38_004754 [Melastoma candidum]